MLEAQQASPVWLTTSIDNPTPPSFAFDRSFQYQIRTRNRHVTNSFRGPAWYPAASFQHCFAQPSFSDCIDLPANLRPRTRPVAAPPARVTGWPSDWNEFVRTYRFRLTPGKAIEGNQAVALDFQKGEAGAPDIRGTLWLAASSGQFVRCAFELGSDIRSADGSVQAYRGTKYEIDFAPQPNGHSFPVHFRRVFSREGQREQLDITYSHYERFDVDSRVDFEK